VDGVAPPVVGHHRSVLAEKCPCDVALFSTLNGVHDVPSIFADLLGTPFVKMTGSGNDFVVFLKREVNASRITSPEVIRAICNRHNGIGADGVVLLEEVPDDASNVPSVRLRYFNSDGSLGELCGNATLCSTVLAVLAGLAPADTVHLLTDAGTVSARVDATGAPSIALSAVEPPTAEVLPAIALAPGERRMGFALVGVPHTVILVDDLEQVAVDVRGRVLRNHPHFAPAGTNVNWVWRHPDTGGWGYRTYERGVEGETLACGTGAVAAALLLHSWGLAGTTTTLRTRSGRHLAVDLVRERASGVEGGGWLPRLSGEGRVVFRGQIETLG